MIDLSGSTEPDLLLSAKVLARIDVVARAAAVDYLVAGLERHGRSVHSFLVEGVEVDVLPYGGIEEEDRTILCPTITG